MKFSLIPTVKIADDLGSSELTPGWPMLHLQEAGRQGSRTRDNGAAAVNSQGREISSLDPLLDILGCVLACLYGRCSCLIGLAVWGVVLAHDIGLSYITSGTLSIQ